MKCIKVISILFLLLAVSCLRDPEVERNEPDAPTVSCDESSKTRVSFTVSGHVNKIIPNAIYGLIIESEDGAQQEKTFKEQDLSSDNTFLWKVDGLSPGSPYLIKSYISNDYGGRKYSESILVSTPQTSIATLSSVTFDKGSGLLRATIIDDGGRGLEDYGFLYGPSPDIKELKKEKRYSGVLNGIEISLPIGGLKVERPSNFIAYVEDKEGHLAYSPSCLPLALIDIYNLEIVPDNGDATIKIGSSKKMTPVVTPTVELPFVWSSDNETVATVDKDGVVTGLSEGSSTIKASCGELEATHTIVVEPIPVTSVSLAPETVSLIEGQSTQLTATVLPENATSQTVSWSSSNESVATVDQHGLVQAISVGSAYITATADEQSAACQVTVSKLVVPVTSVSLSQPFLTLEEGQSATLIATVHPENATDKTVTWSSSNTAIASVSQDGLVSAIAPGSAAITAKAGNITATCFVSISAAVIPVTSVSLNYDTLALEEGQTATLVATVSPENATDKTVTWSSSNTAIASVSQDGLVSAIAPGSATITAKAGDITATCLVSISAAVIPVTSVSLNYDTLALEEGQSATLVATVSPENATDKTVTWSSSNTTIASVSQDGLVSAITPGSATITAKAGDITATCLVSISAAVIPVTSVSLNYDTLALEEGQSATLVATVFPENATNKTVTWSSSNSSVASVSQDGVVSAIAIGSCTVFANCGGKQAYCQIAVVSNDEIPVAHVSFSEAEREVYVGEIFSLSTTIIPSNATNPQLEWTSSNTAVAIVDSEGRITPVGEGECIIEAKALSGVFCSFTCKVVSDAPVFADEGFRNYIYSNFDADSNGFLSRREALQIKRIVYEYMGCKTMAGIEWLESLEHLECHFNQLTSLDVSNNKSLKFLSCRSNQLTSLDVSQNIALKTLYCGSNQLTSLDVSDNKALSFLSCGSNQLTSLDVSQNIELHVLYCGSNQLTSLDVSQNTALIDLQCGENQLTSLDVSNNMALEALVCKGNQLTSLDVSRNLELSFLSCINMQLTSLDVSNNMALEALQCGGNQLTSLDVSNNMALQSLSCDENQLTSLDVSRHSKLLSLSCEGNQLTSLDVSDNMALHTLRCRFNQLTSLDVSQNTALIDLQCGGNQLTSLDVSDNMALQSLSCGYNQLTSLDVSQNMALEALWCESNQLKGLDLRHNKSLRDLDCRDNPLIDIWLNDGQSFTTFWYPPTATLHYE